MGQVSFDGGRYKVEELPQIRAVSITDILGHTRERYVIHTSRGSVVLKHISKRMHDHIDQIRYMRYPGLALLEAEAREVFPVAQQEDADPDTVARANELAAQMMPAFDLYMLGTIEYPFLTTPEDFEAFFDALEPEEQEALRQMQVILTSWGAPIDYSALEIAERFHIQLVTEDHIRDPTYEQYRALYGVIEQENRAAEKLYKDMGVLR